MAVRPPPHLPEPSPRVRATPREVPGVDDALLAVGAAAAAREIEGARLVRSAWAPARGQARRFLAEYAARGQVVVVELVDGAVASVRVRGAR